MKQHCATPHAYELQDFIHAEFVPAPENTTTEIISGVFLPVRGYAALPGSGQTVPVVETMPDYKWQLVCLNSRLRDPERYRAGGEDVEAVITKLRKWLQEHTPN